MRPEQFAASHRAATLNFDKLVASGVLREIVGSGRRRRFLADAVLPAVEGRHEGRVE